MPTLAPFATRYARSAMVCAIDHLATGAGVRMLGAGGTAADAAVAASAVLAVTAQHQCGMGGDLFALVHRSGEPEPAALNASGRAGAGADAGRLRAEGHVRMPATGDVRSVTVPGCVDGWISLHARFGRLTLADVLEPARAYASEGFPMSPTLAAAVARIAHVPEAAAYTAARPPRPGAVVRLPGVARTLAAIAEGGRDAFYAGEFGRGLLALGAGEFAPEDLARDHADWVAPLSLEAWERRLWTIPPNSQGYVALTGAWIAAGLDLPAPDDGRWAHALIEAARQAGSDRGDVLHEAADGADLIAPGRLAPRRAAIDLERAGAPAPSGADGGTIHVAAIDREGLGVSLIQSNFTGWGAELAVPGTGVFLHCRGTGFSLLSGHAAEYGPGRRPPHTLSPLVVTRDGGVLDLVLGTMGGHSQPQILLQLLARRLAAGADPADAVAAPRWILASDGVAVEDHAPPAWREALLAAGHRVEPRPAWGAGFGHAQMIAVGGGHLAGVADPRSLAGAAAGI